MLVYFLRFFALQRTPKKYGVGGFEPQKCDFLQKSNYKMTFTPSNLQKNVLYLYLYIYSFFQGGAK